MKLRLWLTFVVQTSYYRGALAQLMKRQPRTQAASQRPCSHEYSNARGLWESDSQKWFSVISRDGFVFSVSVLDTFLFIVKILMLIQFKDCLLPWPTTDRFALAPQRLEQGGGFWSRKTSSSLSGHWPPLLGTRWKNRGLRCRGEREMSLASLWYWLVSSFSSIFYCYAAWVLYGHIFFPTLTQALSLSKK